MLEIPKISPTPNWSFQRKTTNDRTVWLASRIIQIRTISYVKLIVPLHWLSHYTDLLFIKQVLCGSEEGTLTIWDLRQPAFPASYYTVHERTSVSDIAFHRTDPTKLFTSSESGELFQWSHKAQQITERIDGQLTVVENDNINPWLCGQRTKSRINVIHWPFDSIAGILI